MHNPVPSRLLKVSGIEHILELGQNGVDGELFKFQFSAVMFHGHYDVPELVVNHLQVVLLQMVFKCFLFPWAVVNQVHFQGPAK